MIHNTITSFGFVYHTLLLPTTSQSSVAMTMADSSPVVDSVRPVAATPTPTSFMYDDISLGSMQPSDEMGGGGGPNSVQKALIDPDVGFVFDAQEEVVEDEQHDETEQEKRGGDRDESEQRDDAVAANLDPVISDLDDGDEFDGNATHTSALVEYFMKVVPDKIKELRQPKLSIPVGGEETIDAPVDEGPTSADEDPAPCDEKDKTITKPKEQATKQQTTPNPFAEKSTHSRGVIDGMTERSTHSRCVIENTDKIEERKEENNDCDAGTKDQGFSVEEYTQISELTMDIPTVAPEPKFPSCSALPTISEAKKYNPELSGCSPGLAVVTRKPVQQNNDQSTVNLKARCGFGGGNSSTGGGCQMKGGRGDVIDFVFELMEDAICTPITNNSCKPTTSKHDAFVAAFNGDSGKLVNSNSLVDHVQPSNSKHSRSQRTTKRSNYAETTTKAGANKSNEKPKAVVDKIPVVSKSRLSHPNKQRQQPRDDACGKHPPPTSPKESKQDVVKIPPKQNGTFNEEQTLDWSKIMSFAEKQLEGDDEKSVHSRAESKFSRISRLTRQSRKSFFTAMGVEDEDDKEIETSNPAETQNNPMVDSTASSHSTSASTRQTIAKDASHSQRTAANISLIDDDNDDEESMTDQPRLLLTSLLLTLLRKCISLLNGPTNELVDTPNRSELLEERRRTREARIAQFGEENDLFRMLRYTVFFVCFFLWPSGIPRRKVAYPHIPTKAEQPSLLKLVKSEKRPTPITLLTPQELEAAVLEETF